MDIRVIEGTAFGTDALAIMSFQAAVGYLGFDCAQVSMLGLFRCGVFAAEEAAELTGLRLVVLLASELTETRRVLSVLIGTGGGQAGGHGGGAGGSDMRSSSSFMSSSSLGDTTSMFGG